MGVDSDLVGVIIACSVVAVCLCVVIVLASCVCFRRLEDKRRKDEKRRSANSMVGWPPYMSPNMLPPAIVGDMTLDQTGRMAGYRPRILSPNSPRDSTTANNNHNASSPRQKDDVINGSTNHQSPHQANHQTRQSPSTPLYSNNNSIKSNGHVFVPITLAAAGHYRFGGTRGAQPGMQDFYDARATAAAMMPIRPFQIHDEFVDTEYYPDVPFDSTRNTTQQDSQSSSNKQAADPGNGIHHSENGNVDATKQTQDQSSDIEEIKSSVLGNGPSKDTVSNEMEGPGNPREEINSNAQNTDASTSHCKVIKKQHGHAKMPEWMVREYEEAESSLEVEEEDDEAARAKADGDRNSSPLLARSHVPGLVSVMVDDYSVTNGTPRDPSQNATVTTTTTANKNLPHHQNAQSWSTTLEDTEGTTSIIQDYSSTNLLKDFTILDYVEAPTLPPSLQQSQPQPPPPPPLPPLLPQPLSTLPPPPSHLMDNLIESEPESPPVSPRKTDNRDSSIMNNENNSNSSLNAQGSTHIKNNNHNENSNDEDIDDDKAIREKKAAVLMQIRQKVNESAERMPPAFTSTPRAAETEEPLTGSVTSRNDDIGVSKRQRQENDGSLDALPPCISDTKL